jgi:hypothetical protein
MMFVMQTEEDGDLEFHQLRRWKRWSRQVAVEKILGVRNNNEMQRVEVYDDATSTYLD